ncbi:glycosyltransferase [Candidatus Synechococcus calcipolaris G9]|uniref:Glycosyltransferase n=1 Tax=Candidatus Synechococcus calcipolaris G9 TaxID=1497997 RepID=A0ABT6F1J9_9SYNE|nr:glycosyltransferase [Candidatus Synechococcus calcipolaris]MDG2991709.1 glycosyltransferase [Candidatus Synechococcus calcipolaris G9]
MRPKSTTQRQGSMPRRWRSPLLFFLLILVSLGLAVAFSGQLVPLVATVYKEICDALLSLPTVPQSLGWLDVSELDKPLIFWPTILLGSLALGITHFSPQPRLWSRLIIVSSLFALMLRYLAWRSLLTLNLTTPLNSVLSLTLLGIEIFIIAGYSLQLYLVLKIKDRHSQANAAEMLVKSGRYLPRVDILIPTYNEPVHILRRTIIGCQALDYDLKTIYLLDDTHRPAVQELAATLGCSYITRPDNRHAKAGNLNHALALTTGELVVVFDADFIPTRNFLSRTLGFFADPEVGLLQTYQSFYNPDPVSRNLGLENYLPQEVEIFSRHYQVLRDGIETALCYGSSFVARRSALDEVGGFNTESLSEDYFTAVTLSSHGYRVLYLDESLSAGLCAEDMTGHIGQRLRWARGTLQAFFIQASPLKLPNLTFLQRLAHLEGLLQWFHSPLRLILLLMPFSYAFLGVVPLETTLREWLYYFLPYYWVLVSSFAWLNGRSRSALISDIYAVAQCIPLTFTVIHTLWRPFGRSFRVTPKGIQRDRYAFNWQFGWPLLGLFIASGVALGINLANPEQGMTLAWIWSAYNLVVIGLALLVLIDAPQPDPFDWLPIQQTAEIAIAWEHCPPLTVWGTSVLLSEGGAKISLPQCIPASAFDADLSIKLLESNIQLQADLINIELSKPGQQTQELGYPQQVIDLRFKNCDLATYRELVELLFCQPGRWQWPHTPSEGTAIALLLKSLVYPRILWARFQKPHTKPIGGSAPRVTFPG